MKGFKQLIVFFFIHGDWSLRTLPKKHITLIIHFFCNSRKLHIRMKSQRKHINIVLMTKHARTYTTVITYMYERIWIFVTLLKYRKCLRGFTMTVLPQTQHITSAIILVGLRFMIRQTWTVTSLHLNQELNCQLPFSLKLNSCILVYINNSKSKKV